MPDPARLLAELRSLIAAHTRPDLTTAIDGLLLSRTETSTRLRASANPLPAAQLP